MKKATNYIHFEQWKVKFIYAIYRSGRERKDRISNYYS
jgi:hypothetical protein